MPFSLHTTPTPASSSASLPQQQVPQRFSWTSLVSCLQKGAGVQTQDGALAFPYIFSDTNLDLPRPSWAIPGTSLFQ